MGESKVSISHLVKRAVNPKHLFRATVIASQHKQKPRSKNDAQLKLYSELLDSDHIHYAYFDPIPSNPADISFQALKDAQEKYAKVLLSRVKDPLYPVLDVGCGMGGLSRLGRLNGFKMIGLTPDQSQALRIRETQPHLPLFESKFEDLSAPEHASSYGTIICSESFQYIPLDAAFAQVERLLRPKGRWIIADYFKIGQAVEKSGHRWETFQEKLAAQKGLTLTESVDITPHILPTLQFASFLARRMANPLLRYVQNKLETKKPAIHYFLKDTLESVQNKLDQGLQVIDPEIFAATKRYSLLVIDKR